MKSFEQDYILRQPLTPALLNTVRVIGEFKGKQVDNEIAHVRPDGTRTIRFRCVRAVVTADWMERLCNDFNRLWQQEAVEPLLLIPAFVLDFLSVHPFRAGNGRMARLLTLRMLYEAGYEVGRYVSLERIIEESKESYYGALKASSEGWHNGQPLRSTF